MNHLIAFLMMATFSVADPVSQPIGAPSDQLFTTTDLLAQEAAQPQFTWYITDNDRELCYQEISDLTIPFDVCSTHAELWNPPTLPGDDNHLPGNVPSPCPEPRNAFLVVLPAALASKADRERLLAALRRAAVRLKKDIAAQDLIEYALLAGLIAVAAGAVIPNVATSLSTIFSQVQSTLQAASVANLPGGGQ